MLRYTSDGLIDEDFAGGGKVVTDMGLFSDRANDTAIQSDGKIVVVGASDALMAIARYNSDGTLDNSFGGDTGIVTLAVGGFADGAQSVALQSDGKIIAAGYARNGTIYNFILVRLNTNGSLDSSFGTNGKIFHINGTAFSVAIQADGKILAAGMNSGDIALARYNSDGSPDTSFDGDGVVTTSISGSGVGIYSMAVQNNGKIVIGGYNTDSNQDFLLVRYNSDGSLDTSFDTDGKVITAFGYSSKIRSVAIQSNG